MEMKTRYLGGIIALFLIIIFLDQNSVAVPVKILVGKPFHLELSLVVVVSMLIGMLSAVGGMFFIKRIRMKRKD